MLYPACALRRCYSSAWVNGFSICSLPSRGEMRTRRVPRATIRPRGRVVSLPASSGEQQRQHAIKAKVVDRKERTQTIRVSLSNLTSQCFFDIIQHQVHQLIISLQGSHNFLQNRQPRCTGPALHPRIDRDKEHERLESCTFSSAVELDGDFFVHVLGQVQDVFLFRFLSMALSASSPSTSTSTSSATLIASSSSTSTAATEVSSFGHWATWGIS